MAAVCEVGAFLWWEAIEELADCGPEGVNGASGGASEEFLELGEDLFDRIEIGEWAGR